MKDFYDQNRQLIVACLLAVIGLAGLWLRLKGINTYSLANDEPGFAYLAARPDLASHYWLGRNLSGYIEHPFLFLWLTHMSMKLFGSSLLAIRLPFILSGVACIPLVFFAGRRIGGERLGLWTAFLAAMNFYMAGMSQVVYTYAWWLFCPSLIIMVALWVNEKLSWRRLAVLMILVPVCLETAYPSLFPLAGAALLLLRNFWQPGPGRRGRLIKLAAYLAVLLVSTYLLRAFIAWRTNPVQDATTSYYHSMGYYITDGPLRGFLTSLPGHIESLLGNMLPFFGQGHMNAFFVGLTLLVALIGLSGLINSAKGRPFVWLLIGTLLAGAGSIALGQWSILWRHSTYLTPFYLLLVASGIVTTGRWLIEKRLYPALIFGLLVLALLPVRAAVKDPFPYAEDGLMPFLKVIAAEARTNDIVYLDPHSSESFLVIFHNDNQDLRAAYEKPRRQKELVEAVIAGRPLKLMLGGGNLKPILEADPDRLWALLGHTDKEMSSLPALLQADFKKIKTGPLAPGSKAFWGLYETK